MGIRPVAGGRLSCGCPGLQGARDGKIGGKKFAEKCIFGMKKKLNLSL
jgi:hypothetical protein